MKTLNLTEVQIEVLYDILLDTCKSIEDDFPSCLGDLS